MIWGVMAKTENQLQKIKRNIRKVSEEYIMRINRDKYQNGNNKMNETGKNCCWRKIIRTSQQF